MTPHRSSIELRSMLDARAAGDAIAAPLADAVNIPSDELPRRMYELPPRSHTIRVADVGDPALAAIRLLQSRGRAAELAPAVPLPAKSLSPDRLWRPAEWLEQTAPALPPGRALDLACGSGRESVWLASLGWDVLGVDLLPDALAQARSLASRYDGSLAPLRFESLDLEQGRPRFEQRFDLIVGFRYLHRPLFAQFADWLAPGGSIIYETFTTRHRECHGRPARDEHLLRDGELRDLLAQFDIIEYAEGEHHSAFTARVFARTK